MNRGNSRLAQAMTTLVITTLDCQIQDRSQQGRLKQNERDFTIARNHLLHAGTAVRCGDVPLALSEIDGCRLLLDQVIERNLEALEAEDTDFRLHLDIQQMLEAVRGHLLQSERDEK